ncbi:hypothetical protein OAU50_06670 [Planctomycetota bacterium]|nr:hypothetical protein [Planctomycetota bacterium]
MRHSLKVMGVATVSILIAVAFISPSPSIVVAQEVEELIQNPELYLPRKRTDDGVARKLREARDREFAAMKLTRSGDEKGAMDKWQNAFGLYIRMYLDFVRPELGPNEEILVPTRFPRTSKSVRSKAIKHYALPYIPISDYLNGRLRQQAWPQTFRDRLERRQSGPGKTMLTKAVETEDYALLARCARFYQFSESGKTALKMLSYNALERGDSVLAIKWLNELKQCWPDEYQMNVDLQLQYLRACRDAGFRHELELELSRMETRGKDGDIDIGGASVKFLEYARKFAYESSPQDRPELTPSGWRTLQGDASRNKTAPPIHSITGVVDLTPDDDDETNPWAQIAKSVPGLSDNNNNNRGRSGTTVKIPLVFPTVHESGIFVHNVNSGDSFEILNWYRHGKEATSMPLSVPGKLRYTEVNGNNNGWGWGWGYNQVVRDKYRVLGSTVGRLKWELDNREADVLFAVLGKGSPQRDKNTDPTGNQIQAFVLDPDPALRVTMPNQKVENKEEYDFLKNVTFSGAPIVQDNRLYVTGASAGQDTFEVWAFCFDVTPKGDPAEGEGKLIWKTKVCAKKYVSAGYGRQTAEMPDVSSLAEQGGMLYFSTHTGCNAGIDRHSGELVWVSKYNRLRGDSTVASWINPTPLANSGFVIAAPYDENLAFVSHGTCGKFWHEYPTRRRGKSDENKHILGAQDGCLIVQGRSVLCSVTMTTYNPNSPGKTDWGELRFRSNSFEKQPIGRGVIAGDMILIPFSDMISMYDKSNGKLVRNFKFPEGVTTSAAPATLTVYCRGESYKDEDGLTRYKPLTVTDPDTGNIYNVENLHDGDEYTFPSGKKVKVKKETFVLMTSADRMFMFTAKDKNSSGD